MHEIHRFQEDERCLNPLDLGSKEMRFRWSLDNPDILCQLHAIRVELILRIVVPAIVPPTFRYPFQYWSRFEQGYSGNPHAHSILYGPFNPSFDNVVKGAETKELLEKSGEVDDEDVRLWEDVTQEVTNQFKRYVSEMHPAKDSSGEALYDFVIENIRDAKFGKPQCVNLREMLDRAFANEHADVDELKRLLLA